MNKFLRILQLNFLPGTADCGLLVLRVWLGLSMSLLHGKGKLLGFKEMSAKFLDPFGIGPTASLALAVFAELFCGVLLAAGLLTRFAALNLVITMSVAFFIAHKGSLAQGPGSGEMAFIYLAGFVALLISGGGRFSLDTLLSKRLASRK